MENTSGQGKASVFPEQAKSFLRRSWGSIARLNRGRRRWLKAGLMCVLLGIVAAIAIIVMGREAAQAKVLAPPPAAILPAASEPVAILAQAEVPAPATDTRLMAPEEFKAGFSGDMDSKVSASGQVGGGALTGAKRPVRVSKPSAPKGRNRVVAPEKPTPPEKMIRTKYNDVMTAVIHHDRDAVTQLLDLGWWVDKSDQTGYTPLMEAVTMNDASMAELLLGRGADPNASAGSPLRIARGNRDAAMEALLLRYGAVE